MANGQEMSKDQLQLWLETANCNAIRRYSVAWVATESPHAVDLTNAWGSSNEQTWRRRRGATLISHISITPDQELQICHGCSAYTRPCSKHDTSAAQ